jgi:hypothetical protein
VLGIECGVVGVWTSFHNKSTRFWLDWWVGERPPSDVFHRLQSFTSTGYFNSGMKTFGRLRGGFGALGGGGLSSCGRRRCIRNFWW